ncbi:family S53 protease-like protein [Mycena capillaripes]|nr:family S53 protease-like protein [Mycena capillaripes]
MAFSKLLSFLLFATAAAGRMVVHESRHAAPAGFVKEGVAPADQEITLRFALTSKDLAGLQNKLVSISTPGSPEFRRWLTKDQVESCVKSFAQPSAETVGAFNAFASANGLKPTVISPNGDWVSLSLSISQANTLFAANFQTFTHPSLKTPITRTLSVSLPSQLVGHVDVIRPTTEFVEPSPPILPAARRKLTKRATVPTSCDTTNSSGLITPTCLQDLYGIPTTPATQPNNILLVTAYEDEFAQTADLQQFLQLLRPDISSNTTFQLVTLNGGENPQGPFEGGAEADLDVQYTVGIATNVTTQFLTVGGTVDDFTQNLLDTTTFLDGVDNPPTVITTSYGRNEDAFGASLATKICSGHMALGARGISVVFASGDGGVRGNHDDFSQCNNNTFITVFPASCPYVTTVGATWGINPETAISFTGGGFSNIFPAPWFQSAAISGYLATLSSDFSGVFNRSGRGYPDVALQGNNFEVVISNDTFGVSGTSASAPTFASIIALINDRLLAAGKPVLGFLNPFLYSSAGSTFTDITVGHNSGFTCPENSTAFDAAQGWDPLSGFGTPNFDALLAAALNAY